MNIYDNKYKYDEEEYIISEESKLGLGFLRQDTELFDDEKYVAQDIINARRVSYKKGGEDWEILKNNEIVLILKGVRFTQKEKEFLRSTNGMIFMINGYKNGWNSISEFKRQIKKIK